MNSTPEEQMVSAIVEDNASAVVALLRLEPRLAGHRVDEDRFFQAGIYHWLYKDDTLLHLAAAGHRTGIVKALVDAGASPRAADNRRRSAPLHYAADGSVADPDWNGPEQVATIQLLLDRGADVRAQDMNGATALHRAVRTRCFGAVEVLLDAGANPATPNASGSTAFHLAVQTTGRGGSGEHRARDAQRRIIELFLHRGVSPKLRDGRGVTVREAAQRNAIGREVLGRSAS